METTTSPVGQAKHHSVYEAIASTLIGFTISYTINMLVLPWLFNIHPTPGQNIAMVGIFTVVSLIRGYYVRRLFNWIHLKTVPAALGQYSYDPGPVPSIEEQFHNWAKEVEKKHPGSVFTEMGLYMPPEKKD